MEPKNSECLAKSVDLSFVKLSEAQLSQLRELIEVIIVMCLLYLMLSLVVLIWSSTLLILVSIVLSNNRLIEHLEKINEMQAGIEKQGVIQLLMSQEGWFCVDYHRLNTKDMYPVPRIEDTIKILLIT